MKLVCDGVQVLLIRQWTYYFRLKTSALIYYRILYQSSITPSGCVKGLGIFINLERFFMVMLITYVFRLLSCLLLFAL